MRFRGVVYRAHRPRRARKDPLSGAGAARRGGRFNRVGVPALYTSLSLHIAVREVSRAGMPVQPTTLCSCEVDSRPIFDATSVDRLREAGVTGADLECPGWRRDRAEGRVPASRIAADRLIAAGFAGMLVPAFCRGAAPEDRNLVLWKWGDALPSRIRLVDDEGRLTSE